MDTNRLNGKHILITGAAQGMGAAVAHSYAEQGAKLCLGDVNVVEWCVAWVLGHCSQQRAPRSTWGCQVMARSWLGIGE